MTWEPLFLSLKVSFFSFLILVPISYLLAWFLRPGAPCGSRFSKFFHFLGNVLVQLPLVLPPVVVGYFLLWALGPSSYLGECYFRFMGQPLAFSTQAAVLAGVVVGLPFLVKALQISIQSIDLEQFWVAESLGAHPFVSRLFIVSTQTGSGLVSGSLLAFARCFGEFGATMIFASSIPGETRTVPLAIYTYSESFAAEGSALVLCFFSVVICAFLVWFARVFESRHKVPRAGVMKAFEATKGNK